MYINDVSLSEFVVADEECNNDKFKSLIDDENTIFVKMGTMYGIKFQDHPVPLKRYEVDREHVLYRRVK